MRLYTDIDPFCCAVLRARVADGGLPPGDVLEADIRTIDADTIMRYTQIHLFAGIGGSPLGFKWAGWPDEWSLVTGGFPCQDISSAGKGAGLDGARSSLFWEAVRVIDIRKPSWALIENVGALSSRGLDRVAGALGEVGYHVHAFRMGAWAVGAPHPRERWWFVAHADSIGQSGEVFAVQHRAQAGQRQANHAERPVRHSRPKGPGFVSEVPRGTYGLPAGMVPRRSKQLEAIGNSQDPGVVEVIARAMMESITTPLAGKE